jgi:hypothetical protein
VHVLTSSTGPKHGFVVRHEGLMEFVLVSARSVGLTCVSGLSSAWSASAVYISYLISCLLGLFRFESAAPSGLSGVGPPL